jgi:hypothetical protein
MIGGITAKHDSNALMDEHQHIAVCIRIVSLVGSIAEGGSRRQDIKPVPATAAIIFVIGTL